jgi:methylmalonyl-CoA mutase N-terminal domain/subunit
VRTVRRERDAARSDAALAALREASRTYIASGAPRTPLMELIVDAVRARASVGEIADSLRAEWGTHRPT